MAGYFVGTSGWHYQHWRDIFYSPDIAAKDWFNYYSGSLYSSVYTDEELSRWAEEIANLSRSLKSVYTYFNNDAFGFAVKNAFALREKLVIVK